MAYEADLLEAGRAAKDVTRLHEAATASTAFLLELIGESERGAKLLVKETGWCYIVLSRLG